MLCLLAAVTAGGPPTSPTPTSSAPTSPTPEGFGADSADAPAARGVLAGELARTPPALEHFDSAEEAAWTGSTRLDSLLEAAIRSQARGDAFECARAAARVAGAPLAGEGADAHERKRLATRRARAEKLLRSVAGRLTRAEAACAAAWGGPASDLALRYARAMLEGQRPQDAAAEALAILASDPGGARAGDAVDLLRKAGREPAYAGGAHHSVYRIGAFVPLSGDYAAYGASLYAGLVLAVDEANAGRKLPLRLTAYDTGGEPWRAAAAARRGLSEGAGVLVGSALSVPTLVLAGASQAHGVPLVAPSASEEAVGDLGPGVFQTGLPEAEQGRVLARYAVGELRTRKIAVLGDAERDFAAAFASQAVALGATAFPVETPGGRRDARPAVSALRRAGADAVLLPLDAAEAEIWISALARERLPAKLLASEAVDPRGFHPDVRKEAEGTAVVGLDYALPELVFAAVDSLSRARFGIPADRLVRQGYLTGRLLARAIHGGAVSPALLAETLAQWGSAPAAPGRGSHGFVRHPAAETRVPVYVLRRGALLRVR